MVVLWIAQSCHAKRRSSEGPEGGSLLWSRDIRKPLVSTFGEQTTNENGTENEEIVGWTSLIPPAEGIAVLDDLWVEPEWMGKGVGANLFLCVSNRARELGAVQ